ncbi:MAG: saccharopine dehydrogenase C-terminal domain-containing protein [Agriterribacter sp.]
MKNILVFGTGKSATSLIEYLIGQCIQQQWQLVVADANLQLAQAKIGNAPCARAVLFDMSDEPLRNQLITESDLVISMLPPALHLAVAENCIAAQKHLLTASYVEEAIRKLAPVIAEKGLLFLCEMGLDPGIDHMSAMQMIHGIQQAGGKIHSFYSHCGGLVAPESDNNPWHYKVSWNPRNIVLAGKTGAMYRRKGKIEQLAYQDLFDPNRTVAVPGYGLYAWYPNRDSLSYVGLYGLEDATTFIRTTLRHPDFCRGWKIVVSLGLTNDEELVDTNRISYIDFLEDRIQQLAILPEEKKLLAYLGLYSNEVIAKGNKTAAGILQGLLEERLMLQPNDKDMIVMLHELKYTLNGEEKSRSSCLVVKGENNLHTAMAKTVGLPLGIAATLILQEKIIVRGLHIPVLPEIYEPVLRELKGEGVIFKDF